MKRVFKPEVGKETLKASERRLRRTPMFYL